MVVQPSTRFSRRGLSRRALLVGGLAAGGAAVAAACGGGKKSANTPKSGKGKTEIGSPATLTQGQTAVPGPGSTPTIGTSSGLGSGPAKFVSTGPPTRKQVALTLHLNGDDALIDAMLNTLAQHRTVVTAFIVGNWLDANRSYAKRLQGAGHELANHTWTHPTFSSLGPAAMDDEITRCRDLLQQLTGSGGRWFRPSGTDNGVDTPGQATLAAAGRAGYATVAGYDVDPSDYKDPGASAVVERTLASVKPGSIVSLHFGHPGTVDAMPQILSGLNRASLQPVTLTTLLGRS